MIAGNDERIAIVLETQARMEGVRQVELGLGRVGRMASDVLRQGQLSALQQANAQAQVKNAFDADIVALTQYGRTIDVTNQKSVAAFKESVAAQRQLMVEAKATTQQFQALDAVMARIAVRAKATRGAGVIVDPRTGAEYDKLSPKIRTAANAASTMAFAATSAQMGMGGAAIAAGTMATSLATLTTSARLAAGATGIGAVVVVGVTLLSLFKRLEAQTDGLSESFKRTLQTIGEESPELALRLAQANRTRAVQAIADLENASNPRHDLLGLNKPQRMAALEAAADEASKDEARQRANLQDARRSARRRAAEEAKNEGDRESEQRLRDAREAIDIERDLGFEIQKLTLQRAGRTEAIRNLEADRDFERREREINELKISEDRKTELIRMAYQARIAAQDEFAREMEERTGKQLRDWEHEMRIAILRTSGKEQLARQADADRAFEIRMQEIDRMQAGETDKKRARTIAKRKHEADKTAIEQDAFKKREAVALSAVQAISRGTESVAKTLKRLALEPIITELEGIAARELVRAAASWMNPFAALKHVATAGLAVATARKLSQAAGGGSGTGGGGGGGGSGGGTTFEPRVAAAGSPMSFTLIMRDKSGRETARQTIDDLTRAGALKIPGADLIVGTSN